MKIFLLGFLIALAAVVVGAQEIGNAPVKNFVLPMFAKEGPRTMTLRGTEARRPSPDRIDIVDMNLTRFSGDAAQHVDDVLLAPSATFFPNRNLAMGKESVRLIRDEMEVTGEDWTYNHTEKKVTIDKNVRVVFHAQLKDILK